MKPINFLCIFVCLFVFRIRASQSACTSSIIPTFKNVSSLEPLAKFFLLKALPDPVALTEIEGIEYFAKKEFFSAYSKKYFSGLWSSYFLPEKLSRQTKHRRRPWRGSKEILESTLDETKEFNRGHFLLAPFQAILAVGLLFPLTLLCKTRWPITLGSALKRLKEGPEKQVRCVW